MIYVIGSLRNPKIPEVSAALREHGFEVFDDWYAAGPHADDSWRDYEQARGHSLQRALRGYAARHVFDHDKFHLSRSHGGVMVMPAGKSAHLELGYLSGQGRPVWTLFDAEPDRYDVMSQFSSCCFSLPELVGAVKGFKWPKYLYTVQLNLSDALWLAGLLEGEASFVLDSVGTGRPRPRIALQMTDEDTIRRVAALLDSRVWGPYVKDAPRKPVWACGISGIKAAEYMRVLRPYMGVRRGAAIDKVLLDWEPHKFRTWRRKGNESARRLRAQSETREGYGCRARTSSTTQTHNGHALLGGLEVVRPDPRDEG